MCGIFGIWHKDGRPVDLISLRRGTNALRHRGPDDEGYLLVDTRSGRTVLCSGENTEAKLALPRLEEFVGERFDLALGFRRLSILDLSPAGHQPMADPSGRYWLIFNGEIYNYIELREELAALGHPFRTGTDTEVILAAYREWGQECLRRFNGMWAFAIWDGERRQLFAARDRFGVKPFYMTEQPSTTFAFASEIKALLCAGVVQFRPSALAIAGFVANTSSPSHERGETFFEGVRSLPAAHYALVSRESYSKRRYWSLPVRDKVRAATPGETLNRYGELFTDAVRLRLRADVPVGTCLSGGVDSSSIVAVAGELMVREHAVSLERLGEHQQTFSAVYDSVGPWNERRYIDKVVERTGAAGNYVFPTGERLWEELERLVWHQDEPFQTTSIFAQWCVMGLARERGVTVLLDGQGADELLGGYRPFAIWVGELLRRGRWLRAGQALRDIYEVTGVSPASILPGALVRQLPAAALRRVRLKRVGQAVGAAGLAPDLARELLEKAGREQEPYRGQRSLQEHLARQMVEESLPNLLRFEDRNSMAFSIEARVPFLDYRLAEYVFTQAAPMRIHKGWTKWIQRKAVETKLPDEIVWRRDKVGFETPEQRWMREGESRLLDILDQGVVGGEYLDLERVRRDAPRLLEEDGGFSKVWRWANVLLWLRCYASAASDSRQRP